MTRSPSATSVPPVRRRALPRQLLALACVAALVTGCGSTPPSRFYVLAPTDALEIPMTAPDVHLGLETVVLPTAVDRPQMVTVVSEHERRVSELDRWAEPLAEGATRLLGQYLEAEFGATSVVPLPNRYGPKLDGSVSVEVLSFDAQASGNSSLTARVHVRMGDWERSGRVVSTFDAGGLRESGGAAVAEGLSHHLRTVAGAAAEIVRAGREAAGATSAGG